MYLVKQTTHLDQNRLSKFTMPVFLELLYIHSYLPVYLSGVSGCYTNELLGVNTLQQRKLYNESRKSEQSFLSVYYGLFFWYCRRFGVYMRSIVYSIYSSSSSSSSRVYKEYSMLFYICGCCSWEIGLNDGIFLSLDNM
jgi:hypothetical protein